VSLPRIFYDRDLTQARKNRLREVGNSAVFLRGFSENSFDSLINRAPHEHSWQVLSWEGRSPCRPTNHLAHNREKKMGRHGIRPSLDFSGFLAGKSVHGTLKKAPRFLITRVRRRARAGKAIKRYLLLDGGIDCEKTGRRTKQLE
jgi:hypothetical protein